MCAVVANSRRQTSASVWPLCWFSVGARCDMKGGMVCRREDVRLNASHSRATHDGERANEEGELDNVMRPYVCVCPHRSVNLDSNARRRSNTSAAMQHPPNSRANFARLVVRPSTSTTGYAHDAICVCMCVRNTCVCSETCACTCTYAHHSICVPSVRYACECVSFIQQRVIFCKQNTYCLYVCVRACMLSIL